MKKHESKKSSRRWVIRAMAVFLVESILATESPVLYSRLQVAVDVADGVVCAVFGKNLEGHVFFTQPAAGVVDIVLSATEKEQVRKSKCCKRN